jgi:alkylation response protein AidB-like acyl-CoA dehydrogenase
MDFGLNDDQREIQRTARDLLNSRANPERVREHAEAGRTDDGLWQELAELGWPGIAVAEEHGGQGLGPVELAILCEELGRSVAPVPFLPTVLAATLIEHAGSAGQRERWLPGLASGELTGAVGDSRDGVAGLVPGGADAAVFVLVEDGAARVLARDDAEVTPVAAIDPTRPAARVAAGPARAADGAAGEPLPGDVQAAIDRALSAVAAELVGVSGRALEMTVAYVKERRQFGTPVGAYQAVSHRCAQMLLYTETARSAVSYAAWAADADPQRLPEAAAMAKAAASDAGRDVTAAAIQLHGGIGFTWEADVHWLYKRAQIDAALLGGARRHRARLATIAGLAAGARAGVAEGGAGLGDELPQVGARP